MEEGLLKKKEEAVALVEKRKEIDMRLQEIATSIDHKKAEQGWKKVLREDLDIVI